MNNKYVVVTGASSGIGYETAKAFANRGKNLIICARRTERLLQLKEEIQKEHSDTDVVVNTVDLSNEKAVVDFYRSLREYDIEVFVNNAGLGNDGDITNPDLEHNTRMIHVNVNALALCPCCMLPIIKIRKVHSLLMLHLLPDIPCSRDVPCMVQPSSLQAPLQRALTWKCNRAVISCVQRYWLPVLPKPNLSSRHTNPMKRSNTPRNFIAFILLSKWQDSCLSFMTKTRRSGKLTSKLSALN